jgi:mannose-6-phosphate isomerase-like protein (cupin superfamily)
MKVRRVITGLDAEGRSCVALDETMETISGGALKAIWKSDTTPARNDEAVGAGDFNFSFDIMRKGGTALMMVEVPLGPELGSMGMHATDTLDYCIVVRGRMELVLETGSVVLEAGDVFADRGVLHGARSLGETPAVMAVILVPAHPVGEGATV